MYIFNDLAKDKRNGVFVCATTRPKTNNNRAKDAAQDSHFTVTVDCRHRVMYLEKRPDWNAREIFNRAGFIYDDQEDATR